MKRFEHGQRVKVVSKEHPLNGQVGIITRCRMADDGAWTQMSEPLPETLAKFPRGDSRRDHIILYPDECEKA